MEWNAAKKYRVREMWKEPSGLMKGMGSDLNMPVCFIKVSLGLCNVWERDSGMEG